ncbi:ABC transporter permease subunit [Brevibacterium sp. 5221]|uniref:ABC transporter permease subunit n=1 Tax=Brevibacterium rongguiense TaxID=2695267 RepID=A0A6N9H4K6_9MICO|nr:ABC transporter permease [Brevibacterium rongguiense]MYM18849.1 ABC transporter permease subunit [Brevibacterium rongguiense]
MSDREREPGTAIPSPHRSAARSLSALFGRRPRLALSALLVAPVGWLVLVYIVALLLLLITALWTTDSFTGLIVQKWNLENFKQVVMEPLYRTVTLRTLGIALAVTAIDVLIALPVGYYMAKVARPRTQAILVIAFMMPLWAAYLVKAYAWRSIFSDGGILSSLGHSPGLGLAATITTMSYIWLPYVIMPVYAGFQRVPNSLLEAAGDLGAKGWRTFRAVIVPLVWPSVIAGSIFSFSLTLGDYIAIQIVGGSQQLLGTLIYSNVGTGGNMPLAAAIAFIPIVIILVYLLLVRRTGALKNL